jgi:hypothetical protein
MWTIALKSWSSFILLNFYRIENSWPCLFQLPQMHSELPFYSCLCPCKSLSFYGRILILPHLSKFSPPSGNNRLGDWATVTWAFSCNLISKLYHYLWHFSCLDAYGQAMWTIALKSWSSFILLNFYRIENSWPCLFQLPQMHSELPFYSCLCPCKSLSFYRRILILPLHFLSRQMGLYQCRNFYVYQSLVEKTQYLGRSM